MTVEFISLKRTYELHEEEYSNATIRALKSGWYILGSELEEFEKEFAAYLGMKHCIGCGNGQDALILAVRALGIGPGDEVIVAGNTYIATVLGVTENGATPVFVDCDDLFELDVDLVEKSITANTKAILTTNLYGQCSRLPEIRKICDRNGLYMLEDCAQSHGASINGVLGGTVGDVNCFSFYPTKPLGALGDAGALVTNDAEIAEKLRMLRNYGSRIKYVNEICGRNSRLDEIQAACLRVGLAHLNESNDVRRHIASRYISEIDNPLVALPLEYPNSYHVYHIFPVLCEHRDELQEHLNSCGIRTQIHYPIPPHLAECYASNSFANVSLPKTERFASQELSLPIYCGMPEDDIDAVIEAVNTFSGGGVGRGQED